MGKKRFVPRCTTGYKSCHEKYSLFSAPKDDERLKLWRHAIPRKDRLLQGTECLRETFRASSRNKNMDCSVQRQCTDDRATTSIAGARRCSHDISRLPALPLKKINDSEATRGKAAFGASETKGASSVSNDDDPVNRDLSCDETSAVQTGIDMESPKTQLGPEEMLENGATATKAPCSPFGSLCGEIPQSFLPSDSWGHHKLELDGVKSAVFSQMKRVKKLDCSSSEKISETRATTTFVNPRIVEIDKKMKANVVLMGQSIPLSTLQYTSFFDNYGRRPSSSKARG